MDGVKFISGSSWILIRRSGTEPKIRVYMESKDEEWIRKMVKIIEALA
jgi:phosphomannomutase/phosphoglucomutase